MIGCSRVLSQALPLYARGRPISDYVRRMRTLQHWMESDESLAGELEHGRFALMVDRMPLVSMTNDNRLMNLPLLHFSELKHKLGDYGLSVDLENSALIDIDDNSIGEYTAVFGSALQTVSLPSDSPISMDEMAAGLGRTLGGQFVDLRRAMLTLETDRERNLLTKMNSLLQWSRTYRRCPKCASALRTRASKTAAACVSCGKMYYPTGRLTDRVRTRFTKILDLKKGIFQYAPVMICLVSNRNNTHALLIRYGATLNTVYTLIAGFAHLGEPLEEAVRREVAEEVGIECDSVRQLGITQAWPIPEGSLMCAFRAVADSHQKIDICTNELSAARWFSREDVKIAFNNTLRDPQLTFRPMNANAIQQLRYIPPEGAISHRIIKLWLDEQSE